MIDTNVIIGKLSKLANIALTDQESLDLKEDIKRIVDFVSQLDQVPTQDLEPLINVSNEPLVGREDQVEQDATRDEILSNTVHKDRGLFLVPKIVE